MFQFRYLLLFIFSYLSLYVVAQSFDEDFTPEVDDVEGSNARINAANFNDDEFFRRRGSLNNVDDEEEEEEDARREPRRRPVADEDEDDDEFLFRHDRVSFTQKGRNGRPSRESSLDFSRNRRVDRMRAAGVRNPQETSRRRPNQPDSDPRSEQVREQQLSDADIDSRESGRARPEGSEMVWNGMMFVNRPIENPRDCIVLTLNKGAACLDPKSFGNGDQPLPQP
ncbi:hypothetical protein K7432_014484 [Basidiobolus ranarum]|uniref:Uncharacterized protein n=1 Tax=Basidiobolus ranarum TaxID=34480 RepID=A0ABR2WHM1_9FUNG